MAAPLTMISWSQHPCEKPAIIKNYDMNVKAKSGIIPVYHLLSVLYFYLKILYIVLLSGLFGIVETHGTLNYFEENYSTLV